MRMRVPYETMRAEFEQVLLSVGFPTIKAAAIAAIFAGNSLDGVYTHGLNRFPTFIQFVRDGLVKKDAEPTLDQAVGAVERWNGNLGPGMLNASFAMARAGVLAAASGIGCAALRNTNHWMRGGAYGWQAAEAGYIGICFTNTTPLMPPWGGTEPRVGNNPLVIAVPRPGGHLVLDMAMSQYSMGKLLQCKNSNTRLPLPGGYDAAGNLSLDAGEIIASQRPLPIGFWKGSGLALMLDILASVLAHGKSTADLAQQEFETGISQIFICLQADTALSQVVCDQIIAYTKSSHPDGSGGTIRYPGEGVLQTRAQNLKEGIPVDETTWKWVREMER